MSQLTIRQLPPEVEAAIKKGSHERGISLNKAVILLLERSIGLHRSRSSKNFDLDRFCGLWTSEQADEFDQAVAEFEELDKELWK